MKFNLVSLDIRGYRGIRHVELNDLSDTVFITGRNGNKKSTILLALQELLVGRTFDARGKVNSKERIITDGMDAASITANIKIGRNEPIVLKWLQETKGSPAFAIQHQDGSAWSNTSSNAKDLRRELCAAMQIEPRHLELALMPWVYLFGSEDVGGLLGELIFSDGEPMTVAPQDPAIAEQFKRLYGRTVLSSVDDVKEFGKRVYNDRAKHNKDVAGIMGQIDAIKDVTAPLKPNTKNVHMTTADLPDVLDATKKLHAMRDELNRNIGTMKGVMGNALPEKLEPASEKLTSDIATFQRRLDRVVSIGIQHSEKHTRLADEQREIDRQYSELSQQIARARANMEIAKSKTETYDAIVALAKNGTCPCGGACPSCDGVVRSEDLARTLDSMARTHHAITASMDELEKNTNGMVAKQHALEGEEIRISTEFRAVDAQDQAEYNRTLNDLTGKINSAKSELEIIERAIEASNQYGTVDALMEKLELVNGRIGRAEAARDQLQKIEQRERLQVRLNEMKTNLEQLYEWAVGEFYHGAALKRRVEEQSAGFLSRCNESLERFGMTLGLAATEKSIVLKLSSTATGFTDVPIDNVSKGERACVTFAIADAFAPQGIVAIDDTDGLDPVNRAALYRRMRDIRSAGTLLIVGASDYGSKGKQNELQQFVKRLLPVDVVLMQNGTAEHFGA